MMAASKSAIIMSNFSCMAVLLLLCTYPVNCQEDGGGAAAAAAQPAVQAPSSTHGPDYGHKTLVPVSGLDIGLFIVIAVALFIASGAGVGGGVLVVPALLIIGQFNAITAVALSNVTILASAVANMLFNLPRHNPVRQGPLIDWDLVLLLGPPTVVGSIAGSYINMVIPSWVTKLTLFLLLLPMTWRMIQKAQLLYGKETAARKAAAAEAAAATKDPAAAGGMLEVTAAAMAAAETTKVSLKQDGPLELQPTTMSVVGPLPEFGKPHTLAAGAASEASAALNGLTIVDQHAAAAAADGAACYGAGGGDGHHSHMHNPLSRLSATLSSLAHSELGDLYGPDLAYLDDDLHDFASPGAEATAAAPGGHLLPIAHPAAHYPAAHQPPPPPAAAAAAAVVLQPDDDPIPQQVSLGMRDCVKVACWQSPARFDCTACPHVCEAVRAKVTREEAAQLPLLQVGLLAGILLAVAVLNLTAGFLVPCGTWQYWLLVVSPMPVMLLVWFVTRHHVLWKAEWKRCLGMLDVSDLKWDRRTTAVYPAVCISAGIIAGMLGLGGGLVLTPLMLELGVSAPVSAASTQVTLLISSSTSAIVYAVTDSIPWGYGLVLVVVGFLATLLGQWIVSELVRRLGRNSILVIILAAMFSAATAAALAVVVMTIVDVVKHPAKLTAHKSVCPTFG